ncbi:hypothetical protein T440DRAFT_65973 [Plenodomus tracheiphilus IPT5]|uniref:Uncharacterized protein n=1 Tax=Plenodomus tracheiphilus IPT5 TaxID=1408161 RepID=A0A6A7BBJ6_9PLEO|nr:hypothetical protein T440DRAFT_65973 [Plenodomus tracheiphilus IPT5]
MLKEQFAHLHYLVLSAIGKEVVLTQCNEFYMELPLPIVSVLVPNLVHFLLGKNHAAFRQGIQDLRKKLLNSLSKTDTPKVTQRLHPFQLSNLLYIPKGTVDCTTRSRFSAIKTQTIVPILKHFDCHKYDTLCSITGLLKIALTPRYICFTTRTETSCLMVISTIAAGSSLGAPRLDQ